MSHELTFEGVHHPWVVSAYNATVRLLFKLGLPRPTLKAEGLKRAARRQTRLADFGSPHFEEPLGAMLCGLNDTSNSYLTPAGRAFAYHIMLGALCNRLTIREHLRTHPEILETPVKRPLIIVSLPRTGSTFLQNLLALDPAARPLLFWEGMTPAPIKLPSPPRTDPRIGLAKIATWLFRTLAPNLTPTISPIRANDPEECHPLLRNTFVYGFAMGMPAYREWFLQQTDEVFEHAYREYREQLQLLQWQRPVQSHWLLKSPIHLWSLGPLLKALPDASIVRTHRDPNDVVPSFCSLIATVLAPFVGRVSMTELGRQVLEITAEAERRARAVRDGNGGGYRGRFFDVDFQRLTSEPIAVVRDVYDQFGYEYTAEFERRLVEFVAARKSSGDNSGHRYSLDQFGLDEAMVARRFSNQA